MKHSPSVALSELGRKIKAERKARGLNQTQLGNLSGTSINFVSQVESGKPSAQIEKVLRLLQVLGFELLLQRGNKILVINKSNKS